MTTSTLIHPHSVGRGWPAWPIDLILAVLFVGPVITPLFQATELPLISDTGMIVRSLMANYVCPTPESAYLLLGMPMAVCARCWGSTFGLLAARFLPAGAEGPFQPLLARFMVLPWALRLMLCALPFLLWPLEIIGSTLGWWSPPLWLLLLNGTQAGFAAGLLCCSAWPGLWPRPAIQR